MSPPMKLNCASSMILIYEVVPPASQRRRRVLRKHCATPRFLHFESENAPDSSQISIFDRSTQYVYRITGIIHQNRDLFLRNQTLKHSLAHLRGTRPNHPSYGCRPLVTGRGFGQRVGFGSINGALRLPRPVPAPPPSHFATFGIHSGQRPLSLKEVCFALYIVGRTCAKASLRRNKAIVKRKVNLLGGVSPPPHLLSLLHF